RSRRMLMVEETHTRVCPCVGRETDNLLLSRNSLQASWGGIAFLPHDVRCAKMRNQHENKSRAYGQLKQLDSISDRLLFEQLSSKLGMADV
ncbi:hypothetical protein J6590_066839, partial [Homalodisca vitripennis]